MALNGETHGIVVERGGHVAETIAYEALADREIGLAILALEANTSSKAGGQRGLFAHGLGCIDIVGALGVRGVHQIEAIRGGPDDDVAGALRDAPIERGPQGAVETISIVHDEIVEKEDRLRALTAQGQQGIFERVKLVALDLDQAQARTAADLPVPGSP